MTYIALLLGVSQGSVLHYSGRKPPLTLYTSQGQQNVLIFQAIINFTIFTAINFGVGARFAQNSTAQEQALTRVVVKIALISKQSLKIYGKQACEVKMLLRGVGRFLCESAIECAHVKSSNSQIQS